MLKLDPCPKDGRVYLKMRIPGQVGHPFRSEVGH
jgi:hypothetical protein